MKYRLVIFDFDGTLGNTLPWFTGIFNSLAARYRFRAVDESDMERLRTAHARDIVKELGIPLWKIPLIAAHARSLLASNLHQVSLFPGVNQVLASLAAHGARLALVTSNSEANVRRILGAENAARFADYQCGVGIFGKAAKVRHVLRSSGIAPTAAILIGDELRDGEAARRARVAFGAVTWGYNSSQSLVAQQPDLIFSRLEEIPATLLEGVPR